MSSTVPIRFRTLSFKCKPPAVWAASKASTRMRSLTTLNQGSSSKAVIRWTTLRSDSKPDDTAPCLNSSLDVKELTILKRELSHS